MTNTMNKTIGKLMEEKAQERKRMREQRIEEIEDMLMEMSFTDPRFHDLTTERNNLLAVI